MIPNNKLLLDVCNVSIEAGKEILSELNKTSQYDSKDFEEQMELARDMFADVYSKNVTEPGVGYRNLDTAQTTDNDV